MNSHGSLGKDEMKLTELRQRLEKLEQEGHGDRSVEVSPAPPPVQNWHKMSREEQRRYRLNFTVMNYVVQSVSLTPMLHEPLVTLTFAEAGEMPNDPELEEAETFAAC